jgi:Tol biopolymer transport system component
VTRRSLVLIGVAGIAATALFVVGIVLVTADRGPPPGKGDVIAYGCKEPNNAWYAICLVRSDGTEVRRLTRRLPTTAPAWSPDGRKLAFTRNEDVGESTTFSDDDLFVMDADGDGVRQLTSERDGRSAGQPTWSPDGRRLAYIDAASVPSGQPSRPGVLFVMNADGSGVRRLGTGEFDVDPAWSPDGSEIAFSRCHNPDSARLCSLDLFVVSPAGGVPRRLTRTPFVFEAAATWSPDGSRIAFARWTFATLFRHGRMTLHDIGRDGSDERLLLRHQHFASGLYSLAWSPDGRTLAFQTSPTRQCTAISLIAVETRAVRALTTCTRPRESAVSPAWQPDADAE